MTLDRLGSATVAKVGYLLAREASHPGWPALAPRRVRRLSDRGRKRTAA